MGAFWLCVHIDQLPPVISPPKRQFGWRQLAGQSFFQAPLYLFNLLHDTFPPNIQNIDTLKPLEFTTHEFHLSHVLCPVSHVTSHLSYGRCHLEFFDQSVKLVKGESVIKRAQRFRKSRFLWDPGCEVGRGGGWGLSF